MRTLCSLCILLLTLTLSARAHIGSPNVYFEGAAGPYLLRVTIRPPAAMPGIARVEVRATDAAVRRVTVQPEFRESVTRSPEAVTAQADPAEPQMFSAPVWILRAGTYAVHLTVEGQRGNGSVVVPLQAVAFRTPELPLPLAILLSLLGAALGMGAIALASRAYPGRWTPIVAGAAVLGGTAAGAWRWHVLDRDYRQTGLSRPTPIEATLHLRSTGTLLRLEPKASAIRGWDRLVTDHGKLMHLFLVQDGANAAFAHLHPRRRGASVFEALLPPVPAGQYDVYGEITRADGSTETLVASFSLPEAASAAPQERWSMIDDVWCQIPVIPLDLFEEPTRLESDDSWLIAPSPAPGAAGHAQIADLPGGYRMIFAAAESLAVDREVSLRFAVFTAAGDAAPVQPYLGMPGHAVVRHTEGTVFTHLHPGGTISMAAQALYGEATSTASSERAFSHEVSFPYAFPRPGEYRIWCQVRVRGRVLTGQFAVQVGTTQSSSVTFR